MQFSSSQILTAPPAPSLHVLNQHCQTLLKGLRVLFETGTLGLELSELLHIQYILVSNNASSKLYHVLTNELNDRIVQVKNQLLDIPPAEFVFALSATWTHFIYVLDVLRSFCPHLEQQFITPGNFTSLSDFALKRWYSHILQRQEVLTALSKAVIQGFNTARQSNGKLPTYIADMATMLALLDPLSNSVSIHYIQDQYIKDITTVCGTRRTQLIIDNQTSAAMARERGAMPQSYSYVTTYCNNVEIWIAQELALCQQILPPSTCQRVKSILLEELVLEADAVLIQDPFDGFVYHCKHNNTEQVGLIYHLLTIAKVDISILLEEIRSLLRQETLQAIQDAQKSSNPVVFINALYFIYQRYSELIQTACYSNVELLSCVQQGVQQCVAASSVAPKLVAQYIDSIIRAAYTSISLTNPHFSTDQPIQQQYSSTYNNTLSRTLRKSKAGSNSDLREQYLLARHRVFYELEIHIQKWVDIVSLLADKDVYEEIHRQLCAERIFNQIYANHGYSVKSDTTPLLNSALSLITSSDATGKSDGNFKLPSVSSALTIPDSLNTPANAFHLMMYLQTHPNTPIFILLEYFLLAQLSAPTGPQLPAFSIEALLRDITSSASLSTRCKTSRHFAKTVFEQKWFEYVDSLGTKVYQKPSAAGSAPINTMNDGLGDELSDQMFPKFPLYPVVSLEDDLPVFVPTVVTQGVWSTTMASLTTTRPPGSKLSQHKGAQLHAELLKTSHQLYPTLHIPHEVLLMLNQFQTFYTSEYTGRLLLWNYSMSSAIISASFKSKEFGLVKTYELVCSFFQLLVLNLFNHREQFTYSEIADLTGLINPSQVEDSTLHLHSALAALAHPKIAILTKSPNTPLMTPTDTFTWNHSFKCATTRFFIPKIDPASIKHITSVANKAAGGTGAAGGSSAGNITQNTLFRRENAVDGAIIRILKKAKQLDHGALIHKVQQDLANVFVPDDAFIKQRIEALIDKLDIERDEDDRKKYRYI